MTALLVIDGGISFKFLLVGYFASFMVQLVFATVAMFVSIVINESVALFTSIGLSLGMFIFDAIARMKGIPDFVKYLTPYYYLDLKGTAETESLKPEYMLILLVVIIIFVIASVITFRRKDVNV